MTRQLFDAQTIPSCVGFELVQSCERVEEISRVEESVGGRHAERVEKEKRMFIERWDGGSPSTPKSENEEVLKEREGGTVPSLREDQEKSKTKSTRTE